MRLGIIGGGRAAWAFGSAWIGSGGELSGVVLRSSSPSPLASRLGSRLLTEAELARSSEIILIAVSDQALAEVIGQLLPMTPADLPLFHPSGSLTSGLFHGRPMGFSLHPLRSLPPVGEPIEMDGTLLAFEGPPAARALARTIVSRFKGRFLELDAQDKPLYHAAAVLSSNDVAVLLDMALATVRDPGVDPRILKKSFGDLAHSAIDNWVGHSGASRFTGPVMRGDRATIQRHLDVLSRWPEREVVYRLLAIELARRMREETDEKGPFDALLRWLTDHRPVP